jgi:demethylmenaquinone methyltransferase/2-methoxy-6-polyprenyl-1,4-benzoquinol methylase
MFDAVARRYDLLNQLLSFGLDRRWRAKTARLMMNKPTARVLDVCTGTGDLAIACAREARDATVVGLDFSQPMLSLARDKLSRHSLSERIRLVRGDALTMPFRDGSFDAAGIAFGARNLEDLEHGLREMARVVRPGGTIAVLELVTPRNPLSRFYLQRLLPRIGGIVSRMSGSAYDYLAESVLAFLQPSALAELMTQCGLVNVTVHNVRLGIVTICTGETHAEGAAPAST